MLMRVTMTQAAMSKLDEVVERSGDYLRVLRTPSEELIEQVRGGLPFSVLESLRERLGVSFSEVAGLVRIPERTLARRRHSGRLSTEESERVLRIERLFALAVEMLRDPGRACVWLKTSKVALGGQTPLVYADTEVGAREVENLIGRIRHGVFS